ncbi:MAG: amidohydrolase [Bacteroidetes bacterium]|nr:MAG: amidohydrolase [Bacteroidota bacterium]
MWTRDEELYLQGVRQHLHQYPELSGQEKQTQAFLKKQCEGLPGLSIQEIAGTGLLATLDSGKAGPCILIRGDIDALPIQEINDFIHRSETDGVSHKCGHDGHATVLLGLVRLWTEKGLEKGCLHFLFQPAEEDGRGAAGVMAEHTKISPQPDKVYAFHNLPGYPLHQVVCRPGSFTAAADSILLELNGKTSHAAEPELGLNPALAMAEIIQAYQNLMIPDPANPSFQLLTPIYATMGEKSYGVSAGHASLHYTLRTWSNEVMASLKSHCESLAKQAADRHGLQLQLSYTESFFSNQNLPEAVKRIEAAAHSLSLKYEERPYPFKWGEDFGLLSQAYGGAMFGIGSGEDCPALHNPDYDFPDDIIETGVKMFDAILEGEFHAG